MVYYLVNHFVFLATLSETDTVSFNLQIYKYFTVFLHNLKLKSPKCSVQGFSRHIACPSLKEL
jgi:hypothetical protein